MNNQELEQKIKEIINIENMFDMIVAAKKFEPEYKNSDFYKVTKMNFHQMIKDAKVYYLMQPNTLKQYLQDTINGLDMSHLNQLFDQVADVFGKENAETTQMLDELKDFKTIIKS